MAFLPPPNYPIKKIRNLYNQMEDSTHDNVYLTEVVGGSGADNELVADKNYPLNTITVEHTVEVV